MKAPEIIKVNGKRWYKQIIPYKYSTKPFYGYKGTYISYDTNKREFLFEAVELSKWQIENTLYEFLKCRKYI